MRKPKRRGVPSAQGPSGPMGSSLITSVTAINGFVSILTYQVADSFDIVASRVNLLGGTNELLGINVFSHMHGGSGAVIRDAYSYMAEYDVSLAIYEAFIKSEYGYTHESGWVYLYEIYRISKLYDKYKIIELYKELVEEDQ